MPDPHKKKQFLNLPRYAGGTKALREFIAENLHYPKAALDAKVEGSVLVEYDINDNGDVNNPRVLKVLGYGCDEEAVRVISLLRFEKVKNRGVRVKMTTKTSINFKLPKTNINYTVSYSGKQEQTGKDPVKYEYTISL